MQPAVSGKYRFAAGPAWIFGHVFVLAAMVTMVLLGHWQLTVSNRKHFDLQNFGYAIQWWLFTAFAAAIWIKIIRDQAGVLIERGAEAEIDGQIDGQIEARNPAPQVEAPVAYRRYLMPQASDGPIAGDDNVHADYNAYLASLADRPKDSR